MKEHDVKSLPKWAQEILLAQNKDDKGKGEPTDAFANLVGALVGIGVFTFFIQDWDLLTAHKILILPAILGSLIAYKFISTLIKLAFLTDKNK